MAETAASVATNYGTYGAVLVGGTAGGRHRGILSFRLPQVPLGADTITNVFLTLTLTQFAGSSFPAVAYADTQLWSEGGVTWNQYTGGLNWTAAGGDLGNLEGQVVVSGALSSYTADISALNLTWGGHASLIIRDTTDGGALADFYSLNSGQAISKLPHITVRYLNNPPAAITDLTLSPDLSLSEATAAYRVSPVLKWSAVNASDFSRYRIRKGTSSDPSTMTHLAFVTSRGSTTYTDRSVTRINSGTTYYYAIYPEDNLNQSASTNCLVSNVISLLVSDALIGSASIGSSASTLQEIEIRVRSPTVDQNLWKKAKVWWGDAPNAVSYTANLTVGGGYFYARHRYSIATTIVAGGYSVPGRDIRAQIEDVNGFRGGVDLFGTTVTISNLGPIAKIVASPSKQRVASTFSFGGDRSNWSSNFAINAFLMTNPALGAPADGYAQSFAINVGAAGSFAAVLLSSEGTKYRIKYYDEFTTGSASTIVRRDVNWSVKKGDILGVRSRGAVMTCGNDAGNIGYILNWAGSNSSSVVIGSAYPKYLFSYNGTGPGVRIMTAYTNPIHFSSKDSYARGSNRSLRRFKWNVNYNGTFGSNFNTTATTDFYYAWTSATTQFVAVRAVDDTSTASSIDIAGVVIQTESTFRIPDNLVDVETKIQEKRQRAFTASPAIARDYGVFDYGAIEPRSWSVHGHAVTVATGASYPTDAARLTAAFQQAWRIYLKPSTSASYVQGYIMNAPFTQDSTDPLATDWTIDVQEAR